MEEIGRERSHVGRDVRLEEISGRGVLSWKRSQIGISGRERSHVGRDLMWGEISGRERSQVGRDLRWGEISCGERSHVGRDLRWTGWRDLKLEEISGRESNISGGLAGEISCGERSHVGRDLR